MLAAEDNLGPGRATLAADSRDADGRVGQATLIAAALISPICLRGRALAGARERAAGAAGSAISSPAFSVVAGAARPSTKDRSRAAILSTRSTCRSGRRSAAG